MTKLVAIPVKDRPGLRSGWWLGFRFDDGREILLGFKAPFGHCLSW